MIIIERDQLEPGRAQGRAFQASKFCTSATTGWDRAAYTQDCPYREPPGDRRLQDTRARVPVQVCKPAGAEVAGRWPQRRAGATDELDAFPRSYERTERCDGAVADVEAGPEASSITHPFAGVPVSDLDASIDWYTRLFGRPPDRRAGHAMLWEMDEHAWLFIEPNATQARAASTLAVTGLDALLERVSGAGIEHEPIETYSNGVRQVKLPDPDGNAIAFAEPPDAT